MTATVLVIDDDGMIRSYLGSVLAEEGYEILSAATGEEGLALLRAKPVDVIVLDLMLPDRSGISILQDVKQTEPGVQVIMLTAFSGVPSAVKAMKLGAYDYIAKPTDVSRLKLTVSRALKELTMRREIERLRHKSGGYPHPWIVGRSKEMRRIEQLVDRIAQGEATVLIQGESGTGKEVVARAIHQRGPRADKPFVVINCAAIPETLLESELFGFEAGAFTSAQRRKKGLLEMADGGTLFLDEIGEMQPRMQAKILRVLENKTLRRIGGTSDIKVDVRFIAASNRDLQAAIRDGAFREDLYYRLGVMVIHLPPLRARIGDLDLFVTSFIAEFSQAMGKTVTAISSEAMRLMQSYSWPGNIRELRNVIERAMVLCDGREIQPAHLPAELDGATLSLGEMRSPRLPPEGINLGDMVSQLEKSLVREALERANGNQSKAAELLSMTRDQLRYRIEKYGLA